MKAEAIKYLLQSHAEGDEIAFRKAALQVAADESSSGHARLAEEIRSIISRMPAVASNRAKTIIDIAQPRGELADILEGGHRDDRFKDIVLRDEVHELLLRIISENRSRAKLESYGVSPRRRLLFHGAPGCGKTLAAAVLAGEMGLPLMTVRFDALFSRFLGATAVHLRAIFAEMPRRPCVYLFDEFDAVAKARGDSQDVGEMNRVVTAFLQLIDADVSGSIIVAATNHVELLDRAVFRRFDAIIPFEKPSSEQAVALLLLHLKTLGLTENAARALATQAEGWSFADIARVADDAVRTMALDGRERIAEGDVVLAIEELKRRELPTRR
ncbi:MAG: AAA family ATPase [Candidatus Geothermincolia bacterium]